jgi:hypothetical protein
MKTKLTKMKTKTQQVNAVADCVVDLLVAIQCSAGYFTDAETFEQCHAEVARKVLDRVKAAKGNAKGLDVENLLYFVRDGFDLDGIKLELKRVAVKDSPDLAREVLDSDEFENL